MFITTEPDVHESQKRRRQDSGFTLPEVLVSLLICVMLVQMLGQWGVLLNQTSQHMNEHQQAIFLAQAALAGANVHIPEGWEVIAEQNTIGDTVLLQEWDITVKHDERAWQFYYAGNQAGE